MRRALVMPVLLVAAAACATREEPSDNTLPLSTELTGCYDVTVGEWVVESYPGLEPGPVPGEGTHIFEIPPRIKFSGPAFRQPSATRIVVPEGALPSVHGFTGAEIIGDSLFLGFSTLFAGVQATLFPSGAGWAGMARTIVDVRPQQVNARPIELTPVSCDSPPPVSIDVMRPLGRSVAFADGRTITVGEPPPEWLEALVDEDGYGELTDVGPMQGVFGTPERITVSVGRDVGGIVACVAFYYPGTDAFGRLEARLREVYGAPDRTPAPGWVTYRNRITSLVLQRWGPNDVSRWQEDDEPYVRLQLRDARWPWFCS
ncbi:MAG: hypothetical protein OXI76_12860 [Gemmatimonadota bacterium]|nr:hypothetical protein [Gemmatimonadota bacterium]